jgi:pimeloyl-ACP methyl ester carboxylesterase
MPPMPSKPHHTSASAPQLELLSCLPSASASGSAPASAPASAPLLFVHGACAGAWCWGEHFLPYFAEHGRSAYALSLRGHGGSERGAASVLGSGDKSAQASFHALSIDDYVEDVRSVATRLTAAHGVAPVLVGHSMGGLVVQRYLENADASAYPASAAVLMASYPASGIFATWLYWQMQMPFLWQAFAAFSRLHQRERSAITHLWLFSHNTDAALVDGYSRRFIIESWRAWLDMSLAKPNVAQVRQRLASERIPMLVLGGANDVIFPAFETENTARTYDAAWHVFPQMAHGMMLEANWLEAASYLRSWLEGQSSVRPHV